MPAGHGIADMAGDYAQVVAEHLGGRVDLVVGESYGGLVAQYLAALHPDRLGRLVLVVSGCEVSEWGKGVDARLATALAHRAVAASGTAFDSHSVLPTVRVPVLIVSGSRDRFFPPPIVEETAGLVPDGTVVRYEGTEHLGTGSDKRVAADVLAFAGGS